MQNGKSECIFGWQRLCQDVVKDVFRHRLVLKSRARLSRKDVDKIMDEICATVHVPDRRAAGGRR